MPRQLSARRHRNAQPGMLVNGQAGEDFARQNAYRVHCLVLCGRFRKRWGARYGKVKWVSSICDAIKRQKVLPALLKASARCQNCDAAFVLGMRAGIKLHYKSLRMRSQNGLR